MYVPVTGATCGAAAPERDRDEAWNVTGVFSNRPAEGRRLRTARCGGVSGVSSVAFVAFVLFVARASCLRGSLSPSSLRGPCPHAPRLFIRFAVFVLVVPSWRGLFLSGIFAPSWFS